MHPMMAVAASRRLLPVAMVLAMMSAAPALAGQLLIAPTTIQLETGRRSAAVEITNGSAAPVDLQFRAYAWDQPGGVERLTLTDGIAVSPAIATLPPHGKQVFRILDLGPPDGANERSYRLRLNQLPRDAMDGVAVNLEFSLPVFRTPDGAMPRLTWTSSGEGDIRIVNGGSRRVRVAALMLHQPDGTEIPISSAGSTYILANSSRVAVLPNGTRIDAGSRLRGTSDAGPIDVPLSGMAAR